jgi:hypothetical protein
MYREHGVLATVFWSIIFGITAGALGLALVYGLAEMFTKVLGPL